MLKRDGRFKREVPYGWTYIARDVARRVWESNDYRIVMHGNNVNHYHIFHGWHLGYEPNDEVRGGNFDDAVGGFMSYLDKELGTYPCFLARKKG